MRIKIGDYNTLKVVEVARRSDPKDPHYGEAFGLYLDGGDDDEILMPQKYVDKETKVGDEVRVFVYLDQEERPIATTEEPFCKVGDFAYLECSWVNEYGAFLSWGVTKDLFCPFREQKQRMKKGESYIVYVHVDPESYRIVASAKIEKFISKDLPPYKTGQEVSLLVWQKTDLGFKVIIDNKVQGLIYMDQIFQYVHSGDKIKGYIANVRPDGKIDCTLQQTGKRQTETFADVLIQYLQSHNGQCDLGDKSEAEDIKRRFHVSKKVYKRAVGDLYKRHLINITPLSISLVKQTGKITREE